MHLFPDLQYLDCLVINHKGLCTTKISVIVDIVKAIANSLYNYSIDSKTQERTTALNVGLKWTEAANENRDDDGLNLILY